MKKITLVPRARMLRLVCCLAALALMAFQIPAGAAAAGNLSSDGRMRIRLNKTL